MALIGSAYSILIQNNYFKRCNVFDLVFLILKRDSSSVNYENFIIFFECPGGRKSVGPTQPDLTWTRKEGLKNDQFWGVVPTYESRRYISITFFEYSMIFIPSSCSYDCLYSWDLASDFRGFFLFWVVCIAGKCWEIKQKTASIYQGKTLLLTKLH